MLISRSWRWFHVKHPVPPIGTGFAVEAVRLSEILRQQVSIG